MDNGPYGKLYIVATPIGNSKDLSPRAIDLLRSVDIIAAEDTRRSMVLLNLLDIKNNLISNHEYNELGKAKRFIQDIKEGKNIAVITDAGTPCISDPGNVLVQAAIEEGISVIGIPGCCAAITALSISGFDLQTFMFCGFFPRENSERKKQLEELRANPTTLTYVFYESPKRIMDSIDYLVENHVQCRVCLCNDLTKLHEMTFRGTPAEVKEQLLTKGNYDKGEFVLVIALDKDYLMTKKEHLVSAEAMLVDAMVSKNCSIKEAIKVILADENNWYSKNELYDAGLRLKNLFEKP